MAEQKTTARKTPAKKAATPTKEADHLDAPLFDSAGSRRGEVRLPKLIFAEQVNTPLMHQAFVLPPPTSGLSRRFETLARTKILLARNPNVRDLFTHAYLLLAKDCLELLEENFGKPTRPKGIAPGSTEKEAS